MSQELTTQELTTREQQILKSCEEIINQGLETFYVVGRALMTIRDERLFRVEYSSFDEYCRERWDLTRRHGDRCIRATHVVDHISPTAVMPTREALVRPLLRLPQVRWKEAWEEAVATAAAQHQRLGAKHVEAVVDGTPIGPRPRDYGEPMDFRGLRHAPINEQGVVFLFGMVSRELGFLVESVHNPYPDCTGKRLHFKAGKQVWREVKIEFEFESLRFKKHKHPIDCHVIVCWEHNWSDCPVEVIELKTAIQKLDPNRSAGEM